MIDLESKTTNYTTKKKSMISKKTFILLVLLSMIAMSWAKNLNISVEGLNFFDANQRTIIDVNYSVKYQDLTFKINEDKSGAIAGLRIEVKIYNSNKILHQEAFAEQIIVSDLKDIESKTREHIDRYSFDYPSSGNTLEMKFIDMVSKDTYIFQKDLKLINDRYISDVELNDYVSTQVNDKFKYMYRGKKLYKSNPSRIFYKETIDSLYAYFQLQGLTRHSKSQWKYDYIIEVKDSFDQQVDFMQKSGLSNSETANITQAINIQKLPKGIYYVTVKSLNQVENNRTYTDFSISDYPGETYYIFDNRDDEFKLMRYFGYSNTQSSWDAFTSSRKRQEINKFWERYANSQAITPEMLISTLKERIDYSNQKFSHHKPGWASDRGKIYILYGPPDDIEKFMVGELDATDKYDADALLERRAVFNDKEYEIWRYATKKLASYTFFDVNMNNGHKLIYVYNDNDINVSADYKFYLGQDFDVERLK